MHTPLLFTCVLSVLSMGCSVPLDSLKNMVKLQAETINSRIQEHNEKVKIQFHLHQCILSRHTEKALTVHVVTKSHLLSQLKLSPKLLIGDPELYPEVPTDRPIQGLGSIVDTLTIFQKVLHSLPKGHVSQLHSDVSTLQGYLEDRMSSMRCPPRKTGNEKSLEAFLKDNATHHITVGYMALDRLQKFMQRLTVSLDQLKTC